MCLSMNWTLFNKTIVTNYVEVSRDCLRGMFVWWLRNGEDITAKKLAKAVHEVGNHEAEVKINRKFGMSLLRSNCSLLVLRGPL